MLERDQILRLKELLAEAGLLEHMILVGSAALYLTPTSVPPLTADADFLIDCALLGPRATEVLQRLESLGFERVLGSATFVHREGFSMDLLGLDNPAGGDRVADLGAISVLVFEDLCRLALHPGAVREQLGMRVLSTPALAISKLLTWRLEKGLKDKLQALALIGELQQQPGFHGELQELVDGLSDDLWEDVVADAQVAFLGLGHDRSEGYAAFSAFVETGFRVLRRLRA